MTSYIHATTLKHKQVQVQIKYIEPMFTIMTRTTSHFFHVSLHLVCSGLIDKPWSGSVSQALLYLALVKITPHPLVVYHSLNL